MERPTTLYVNDSEVLTIQTTPVGLDDWALGFLFSEGIIGAADDVRRLVVDEDQGLVWVDLASEALASQAVGAKRYLTSGCGKGVTFSSVKDAMMLQPVGHGLQISRPQLSAWMKQMQQQTPLYEESGGMHAAAIVHAPTGAMLVREDIGRHNAADKVVGAYLRTGWPVAEIVMLTSGRISYEMCTKLSRLGIGIGVSRTAVTDQAFRLATRLNIELVGYVRGGRICVYTAGKRIS